MQRISPFLWFEKDAGEIAHFYTSIFKDSKITETITLHDTPSGTVEIISVEIYGQRFTIMAAGPLFRFTPAVSFLVPSTSGEEVDALWEKLSKGGTALMPLGEYPFSKKYGWAQDKYGLSWQILFTDDARIAHKITPTLMFVGKQAGKAEEAINFYASVFKNSKIGDMMRYDKGNEPDKEGSIKFASFILDGQPFAAMDSAREHNFSFNEAISFEVHCETEQELDYYWGKLSADPKSEQCGWLKDRYGLSWQVVPTILNKMLQDKDAAKVGRVTQALLNMKKLDVAALQRAYEAE
jgi:predicted 3-demethylubiquinone-9 3-methyltransferase (glyoxalase superfamily)